MALWFRRAMNWDVSTGPIAFLFTCWLAPLPHSLVSHCSIACALYYTRSFAHSWARGKADDSCWDIRLFSTILPRNGKWNDCTMVQNSPVLRHLISNHPPFHELRSEQMNNWAQQWVQAKQAGWNKQMIEQCERMRDKRVAQYLCLDSWLLWTTVPRLPVLVGYEKNRIKETGCTLLHQTYNTYNKNVLKWIHHDDIYEKVTIWNPTFVQALGVFVGFG